MCWFTLVWYKSFLFSFKRCTYFRSVHIYYVFLTCLNLLNAFTLLSSRKSFDLTSILIILLQQQQQ
jgi:hypothetical protein